MDGRSFVIVSGDEAKMLCMLLILNINDEKPIKPDYTSSALPKLLVLADYFISAYTAYYRYTILCILSLKLSSAYTSVVLQRMVVRSAPSLVTSTVFMLAIGCQRLMVTLLQVPAAVKGSLATKASASALVE